MKDLIKIGLVRLSKNIYYIAGCVLAVAVTYWILATRPIPQFVNHEAGNIAIFVSAAIILYFSIFCGLFCGNENEDGILRNKVMVGHSQLEVYFSNYITLVIAAIGMMICWLIGAIAGGAALNSKLLEYLFIAFLYNAAYIAIIQAIVFRAKKQVTGVVISFGVFYMLMNAVLMGNFFYMITDGNAALQRIVMVLYNMSAIGQCFARTDFTDPGLADGFVQVAASILVFTVATFLGTLGLKKRDIK